MKEELMFRIKVIAAGLIIALFLRFIAYSYDDRKVYEFTRKQCVSTSVFDKQMFQSMIEKYAKRRAQL